MPTDAIAKIHFYIVTPLLEVLGRKIQQEGLERTYLYSDFRCPVQIKDALHDARLLTSSQPIEPGQTIICPIAFLFPKLVRPKLEIGLKFFLKKNAVLNYGEGEILEILPDTDIRE